MVIEKTSNEFIIRFPISTAIEKMQDLIDYLRYKELTANYSIEQSEVDKLTQEINKEWWNNNKNKFL
jgi:hypothetical protein